MSPAKESEHHAFTIVVNGREKTVTEKELGYWDVVRLAFPGAKPQPNIVFTVAYRKGKSGQKGTLAEGGEPVHVHQHMIFDVSRTDRS